MVVMVPGQVIMAAARVLTEAAPDIVRWMFSLGTPFQMENESLILRNFGGQKKKRLVSANPPDKYNVTMAFNCVEKGNDGLTELERFYAWYKYQHRYGVNPFIFPAILINSNRQQGMSQEDVDYIVSRIAHGDPTAKLPDNEYYIITSAIEGSKSGNHLEISMTWETYATGAFTIPEDASEVDHIIAQNGYVEEAVPFLSEAFTKILSDLVRTIVGYINVYLERGDHASTQAILSWGIGLLQGLREGDNSNYFDRVCAALLATLAGSQFLSGQDSEARGTLVKAKELAAFFDAAPSYDESDIRFITRIEGASAHDDLGVTAMAGVSLAVSQFENEEFTALWNCIEKEEENHRG